MTDHPTDRSLLQAFPGSEPPDWLLDAVGRGAVPGITLYRFENVGSPVQTAETVARVQAARPEGEPPLLVAADQEGGQFLALGDDSTPFAGNMALGAVDDPGLTERVGEAIGREAAACGANVVYAPLCDLASQPGSVAVGARAFGDDPALVGRHAAALVRGLQRAGVAATLKHFPGAGEVTADTHHGIGVYPHGPERLRAVDLVPFAEALGAAPPLVMSGHQSLPEVTGDPELPATLSGEVMDGLLRGELGFDGVVVTDALDMRALAQGAGQVVDALAALRAGVDLLLCGPDAEANQRLAEGLGLAWQRGLIDAEAHAASTARVAALRRRLAALEAPEPGVVGGAAHRALADELARRSITLVRDDAGLLPLRRDARVAVLEPRPRALTPADTSATVEPTLGRALAERLGDVDAVVYDEPTGGVGALAERAAEADVAVLATAAADVDAAQAELARAVLATGVPTVTAALRTPWDLTAYPGATTHLCAYSVHAPSTAALADVLVGAAEAEGALPVAGVG